ncbi:MAG TPA: phosphate ABC transporter substrate-binding protein PstS family protein [Acidimicrobiia bacterium]|nr:phosphate ABC transporter substrate-binding protein PstS family protein [Acidimicrobiia bacterium]
MRIRRFSRLLILLTAVSLVAAACGDNDEITEAGGDNAGNTSGASGDVVVSGSSTVEPISALNGELFSEQNPNVAVTVDGPGTGDGFELFCNGETDISNASRAIKEEEAAACEENGVEYVELKVAIDGISVLSSPDNDAVECLGFPDLYALLGPESDGFSNWSDANDLGEELGSEHTPYPDAELVVTAPGEESGTYDSFVEIALEGIAEERGQEAVTRKDYTASPNDNVIIEGISGSPSSLGWVGYAFYVENQDQVKAIDIQGEEGGCVTPTDETIANGEYPLSRSLYIYVNTTKAAENQAVSDYVDFYLSDDGRETVSEVGYVQLTDDEWQATVDAWEQAKA